MREKPCRICGLMRPLEEFHRAAGIRDGHRNECKECFRTVARERYRGNPAKAIRSVQQWREENPDRYAAYRQEYQRRPERKRAMRDLYYRREHGITADRADEILEAQGGVCAICGKRPERLGSMHLDHDHETGVIREFLCITCNQGLGLFQDQADLLRAAADYLARHRGDAA